MKDVSKAGPVSPRLNQVVVPDAGQIHEVKPTPTPGALPSPSALKLIGAGQPPVNEQASFGDRGVHNLGRGRVVGVQIAIPDGHPLKQAIDNAFATDTKLKNPTSALKQYDRALAQNRTKAGDIKDAMVEMVGRTRKGLALNHLVAAKIAAGEPHEDLVASAKEELQFAIHLAEDQGLSYAAAFYNLATLHAHLGDTEAGLQALDQAVQADPKLIQSLAQKDGDMKPLAGNAFDKLVGIDLTQLRQHALNELALVPGADALFGRLSAEEQAQPGTALQGPHVGIALNMDVLLTIDGPMQARYYRSDKAHGTSFVPLGHDALSPRALNELKAELADLIAGLNGNASQISLEGSYHQALS